MIVVPFSTDAPVYHYPYGTIGLIVFNVVMFIAFCTDDGLYDGMKLQKLINNQAQIVEEGPAPPQLADDDSGLRFAEDETANDDSGLKFAEDDAIVDENAAAEQNAPPRVADEAFEEEFDEPAVEKEYRSLGRKLVLDYGEGLKPWQWFTNIFIDVGLMKLITNMLFLWSFGLVVEGKIGALFFVPLYIGIGASASCIQQFLMLFSDGGTSQGASVAVFGLMAIVMVWAPVNEFSLLVSYFWRYQVIEVSHLVFGAIYVGLNLFAIYMAGFIGAGGMQVIAGDFLGFIIALSIGFFLLTQGYVDCEGYDAISFWKGKHGKDSTVGKVQAKERRKKKVAKQKALEASQPKDPVNLEPFQQQVAEAIDAGDLEIAMKLQNRLSQKYPELTWRQADLKRLISALLKQKKLDQAFPAMENYICLFPSDAFTMQSAMAKIWLQQERPKHTLRFMQKMDLNALDTEQRVLFKKLVATAKHQIESGVVEI